MSASAVQDVHNSKVSATDYAVTVEGLPRKVSHKEVVKFFRYNCVTTCQ
jgi:hypothetical protein